jgi:hypothetical protein
LVQALIPADRVKRREFCEEMQLKMEEDSFAERLISDKATFHISGKVNRHNVCHGPFFFTEATATGDSFLDMLGNWLLTQLSTNYDDYIL